jgi:hypothetical protein
MRMHRTNAARSFPLSALAGLLFLIGRPACGQSVMGGATPGAVVHLVPTEMAVLELQEPRKDLPCTVTPVKPTLGFDLRLHAGYEVNIPLKDLAGSEGFLLIVFRVTPELHKDQPVYFSQRVRMPPIADDARGEVEMEGSFDLGEGAYHVDWLMQDPTERVCSSYWDVEAALADSDREVGLVVLPGEVRATDLEPFREEPPVERTQPDRPLSVKVLLNFAPQRTNSVVLRPLDVKALVSILRSVYREPRIGTFSVVAFNLQQQRVIFRQETASRIDFPALGTAVNSLALGTVDIRRLGEKNGDTQFLSNLVRREVGGGKFDAVVFAGPKALLEENVPAEDLKQMGQVESPMFYMNYILDPQAAPWRDAIGNVVKFFRGAEYTISRPKDLWNALTEMVTRIGESRKAPISASAAGR